MADDQPVTRADLAGAVQELRADLAGAVQQLKEYIDERTHDAETRLLRAFVDYGASSDMRMRKLEAGDANATQRLGELERRVTDLDIRVLKLESPPPSQGAKH